METRLSNILKTTNATMFIKTILESTCKVVLGTYNLAASTRPIFLLRAVEFWHLDWYNFFLYLEKASHRSLKTHQKYIQKTFHYGETALLKIGNFVLFGAFYFKNKNSWHFQFSISQIFRQRFVVSENLTYKSQLLLKLRAVELAISFLSLSLRSSW